ncbi:glucitol operon DNA-binding transcriptional repressor SrlR [Sodalis sp. RH16]|jgi:DeoR family glucitol operon repressor|uniref:glucitol operon DNA-binding transcriptional repressor SrlR n=1 Tax=Sodalis sp. RH16 TaxID=3394331 RepID=UPI0039B682A4
MKPRERQLAILELLQSRGRCVVSNLARYFDTTETTIRKDLTILENDGSVVRTHGAVVLNREYSELTFYNRNNVNLDKKKLIASAASCLINDGDSMIFDVGSTVLQLVPYVSNFRNLTIMTNSLYIINALVELPGDHNIHVPGGSYRRKSSSFHGSLAEETFKHFKFNKLFIGADGVDLTTGVTSFFEGHEVSRAMCDAVEEIILLVDSSKFGRKGPNVVCSVEKVGTIITDKDITESCFLDLRKKGVKVLIARD